MNTSRLGNVSNTDASTEKLVARVSTGFPTIHCPSWSWWPHSQDRAGAIVSSKREESDENSPASILDRSHPPRFELRSFDTGCIAGALSLPNARLCRPAPIRCRSYTDRMIPLTLRDRPSKPITAYTFVSPFSFNSAAENGAFFFWFLCVLPSCGGLVWNSQTGQAACLTTRWALALPVLACFTVPLVSV
jgi:hypothetical protein